jgi:hypothetical protein
MQPHRKRLREGQLSQRDVASDRIALALAHHEIFLEHPLHVREQAGAAEEFHLRAEVLAPFAAVVAAPAGMRRRDGNVVTLLHARDAGPNGRDDAGRLVARNQRLAHDEAAVAALEIVVEVRPADAGGAQAQQHFARARRRRVGGFDPQVFLRVYLAGQHFRSLSVRVAWEPVPAFGTGSFHIRYFVPVTLSQPVEKRL